MAFAGREAELHFLNQSFEKKGSQILVVYGPRGVGKTALLAEFARDKSGFYYLARACSDREQRFQWAGELRSGGREISDFPEYEEIFSCLAGARTGEKQVLVVDEFHHIVKGEAAFFAGLCQFLRGSHEEMLVILCSSASGWVENSMIGKIGAEASAIAGFLKVREMSARQIQELYPEFSEDDIVQLYAVLGGVPGLWEGMDAKLGAAGNLIRHVLDKSSRVYAEMSLFLAGELREPAVYNTILTVLAAGYNKLNDIYRHTGFSRAKISVYLKNLMELDLVEKVGAGAYRITRAYVRFYFRFLFPNQSLLEEISPKRFFGEVVEDALPGFVREAYRKG